MKKLIVCAILTVVCSAGAWASIELKGAYLSPSDSDFKSVYGGGGMFGAEISFSLASSLEAWLSGDYFAKTGSLTYTDEQTKLTLIPIGAGLRYKFLSGWVQPYLGAGARYYLYKESNIIGTVNKGGIGFVGKLGANLKFAGSLFLDLFVGYSFCKMKPADFEFGVGGLEIGAGLGYGF